MAQAKPYYINPAFAFVAYPNRDSTAFREKYNIPEAQTVIRGTLRYQGFPEFIKALTRVGWLNDEGQEWLKDGMTWVQVLGKILGVEGADEATLVSKIKSLCAFPNEAEAS